MIKFYKIDSNFKEGVLSDKKFIESYRLSTDGLLLEVIADGKLLDEDNDLKTHDVERDPTKTKEDRFRRTLLDSLISLLCL